MGPERAAGAHARRWVDARPSARIYVGRIGLAVILVTIVLIIVLSPFGMGFLVRFRDDWAVLGNVGQAYGGASAVLSTIALIGVVGSLLLQARQHSIDRMAAVRTQQGHIYDVIRQDPALYWPVIGGVYDNERSVRRRILQIEDLVYLLAGYETGYIPEGNLRYEAFPGLFRYEENRKIWDEVRSNWIGWVAETRSKKQKQFIKIADQELARARAEGPGLTFPRPTNPGNQAIDKLAKWRLPLVAGAAGLTFLLTRRLRS